MGTTPSRPDFDAASVPAASVPADAGPRVSVIVPTYQGAERIGSCLASLVGQTLHPDLFEVVVIQNGPPCATREVVEGVRRAHPGHTIRLIECREPGAGHARNLGIDAARGAWVTFVDDDDWVSPDFLAVLLEFARPGVVPVAYFADIPDGVLPGEVEPDFDNYLSRRLLPLSGRRVPIEQATAVISANAGKLLPTTVARSVRYDESLTSGEDFVFWIGAYARSLFDLHVTPRERGAVYYRVVRPASVSRRELTYDFNVTQRLDCIAALQSVPLDDSAARRLVRSATSAQCERIHDFVVSHPESHPRIRQDAEERDVAAVMPWRLVNRGMARDLAVLYCFTPYQDTSAMVAARRLYVRGVITDVIAQDLDNVRDKDMTSHQIAAQFLDEVTILPGLASFGAWTPTRRYAEGVLRETREMQKVKGPYRTLYSRAMAPQSHFAAALVKLENPDIVWTAEFSDPLLMNAYGEERKGDVGDPARDPVVAALAEGIRAAGFELPDTRQLFSWAEQIAYVLADHIVFTNDHQRDFMLGYCRNRPAAERAAAISSVSPHPTLPERFYRSVPVEYPLAHDRVHIGYFGLFYLTRGLTEVTEALDALSPQERDRVRLHVFTDDPETLELEALRRGLSDVINARRYVPVLQFLNLTTLFDALLVNDASTRQHHAVNPYLPSKISDYRGSGSPIWAIHEPGSMLSKEPVDFSTELGDVAGATAVLRELIARGPRVRQVVEGDVLERADQPAG
jgi:hypothetical protein